MKTQACGFVRVAAIGFSLFLLLGLAACGGGGSSATPGATDQSPPPMAGNYVVTKLVSDQTGGAPNLDANLKNAWGLAFSPTSFVWVSDNATSKSTLYDGNGVPQALVVSIPAGQAGPAAPTGIVFNPTQDFKVSQNGKTGTASFIFAGESGTISGWSSPVNSNVAVTVFDGGSAGKIYKGLAIGSFSGANYLYATDFHNGVVDVFDGSFNRVSLPGGFKDASLPAGFAPYGIQALNNRIYVSYAKQDSDREDQVIGVGLGLIDVFDGGGTLLMQIAHSALNAPWGITIAPASFGPFGNALLAANFGNGQINAFDPNAGTFLGVLTQADGSPIVIDGLWGIAFGNGQHNQPANTLYFTAGPNDEAHGLYGRIDFK